MDKERIIPFVAMAVLLIGTFSTLYVHTTHSIGINDDTTIIINKVHYDLDTIFENYLPRTIQTDDGEYTGIALDELVINTGISCPSCHQYTHIASDGYKQTVSWKDMQQGVLSKDKRVYFPDLAHSFWVRDIIEIEVK
jgi:hypothetical protein